MPQHNDNPKCKKCLYLGCNCDLDEAGECAYVTKPKFSPSWQGIAEQRAMNILSLKNYISKLEREIEVLKKEVVQP